jgi:D-glycero-D-manno-heptose 1,7-bisphosphate phosphatase
VTLRPAVFFDRDGVLNHVVWRGVVAASPRSPDELAIVNEAPSAAAAARAAGFLTFAVTNQPDIARGLLKPADLAAMHAQLGSEVGLDEILACTHDNADACACRKPKPGLLLDLALRHGVDLSRSWMIGDQDRDITCGRAAGCRTILLARSYNSGADADHVVDTLTQAMAAILTCSPSDGAPLLET